MPDHKDRLWANGVAAARNKYSAWHGTGAERGSQASWLPQPPQAFSTHTRVLHAEQLSISLRWFRAADAQLLACSPLSAAAEAYFRARPLLVAQRVAQVGRAPSALL